MKAVALELGNFKHYLMRVQETIWEKDFTEVADVFL